MRILFVHNAVQSFVRIDRDLLAERHDLTEINFRWRPGTLAQVLRLLPHCDMVFGWFASHHTFLPATLGRLLGKKVVICASDYDIANEPAMNYGSMRGGVRKFVNNQIFGAADVVITPSEFSRQLALRNTNLARKPDKLKVIPHGIPTVPAPTGSKVPHVATVSSLDRLSNWRKGINTFVEMSRYIPDITCDLIGKATDDSIDELRAKASANVVFHGRLSDRERDSILASAGAYAQLSYMEGFGVAVIEAMLQECVPVVTNRGALPEVVGDCGVYVPYQDPAAAAEGVRKAVSMPQLGKAARDRVLSLFTMERRGEMLSELLRSL